MGVGRPPDDQPDQGHAVPVVWLVDVHRRPRHRPDVLGVHDRHPERRAVPRSSASRRRTSRSSARSAAPIALAFVGTIFGTTFKDQLVPQIVGGRRAEQPVVAASARRAPVAGSTSTSLTGVGDLGRGHPGRGPAAVPGDRRAARPRDRRGHPRRLQPRGRPDVLARRVRRDRRDRRGRRDQGDPAAQDLGPAAAGRRGDEQSGGRRRRRPIRSRTVSLAARASRPPTDLQAPPRTARPSHGGRAVPCPALPSAA